MDAILPKQSLALLGGSVHGRLEHLFKKATTTQCRAKIAEHFGYFVAVLGMETELPITDLELPNKFPQIKSNVSMCVFVQPALVRAMYRAMYYDIASLRDTSYLATVQARLLACHTCFTGRPTPIRLRALDNESHDGTRSSLATVPSVRTLTLRSTRDQRGN
jgi:hypothetical protein